jgi:predicted transcriptional regulator
MPDGELTLRLDDGTARRLQEAADAAGRPVADYAAELIAGGLDDWAEIDRICDEAEAHGDAVAFEDLRPWLQSWGRSPPGG